MPRHFEKRFLSYTSQQLFNLVAGVESYPEFLPWCKAARILGKKDNIITADLIIGYKMFQEKFTSEVTLDPSKAIKVRYLSGPMAHLTNEWGFQEVKGGCELSFLVDFDFKSSILRAAMEMFFDKAILKMVEAFEKRAEALYG